ncbi:MAG: hypothetical protein HY518_04500 [Candidatus Aenigmarchaeota archaeon]|nr:hypothetical protein [Candidatus Aenigmarchaeota archaeon]
MSGAFRSRLQKELQGYHLERPLERVVVFAYATRGHGDQREFLALSPMGSDAFLFLPLVESKDMLNQYGPKNTLAAIDAVRTYSGLEAKPPALPVSFSGLYGRHVIRMNGRSAAAIENNGRMFIYGKDEPPFIAFIRHVEIDDTKGMRCNNNTQFLDSPGFYRAGDIAALRERFKSGVQVLADMIAEAEKEPYMKSHEIVLNNEDLDYLIPDRSLHGKG